MKNLQAIAALIKAAEVAEDPLDELACRRTAGWLRWCDGFGATLTLPEATRIAAGGALAEAARGLLRRLAEQYPAPAEDFRLESLCDDNQTAWSMETILIWSNAQARAHNVTRENSFA
jgi:hypothetical protein